MKIEDLKEGDKFRMKGQRKFRTYIKHLTLPSTENIPLQHRLSTLIIYDNCRQMIIEPWDEIELENVK